MAVGVLVTVTPRKVVCLKKRNPLPMTRSLFLFLVLFASLAVAFGQDKYFGYNGDPTGTYKLVGKRVLPQGVKFSFNGLIQVKLLALGGSIVLRLAVSQLPNGHIGPFMDTLTFRHGGAVYDRCPYDSTCWIRFDFTAKGVRVEQAQANLNYGCGLSEGVVADGFYRKVSGKVPSWKNK
jgi:hypothetical protein